MLHGPSTLFSYKPPTPPPKPYGFPIIARCNTCSRYIVILYSRHARKRVRILLSSLAEAPALAYSFAKHGPTHFCSPPPPRKHRKTHEKGLP